MVAVSCVAFMNVITRTLPFHKTWELPVNPVPETLREIGVAAGLTWALAVNGERALILKAGVFGPAPRLRSHAPRPCVAARNVRDGLCSVKDRTCAFGRLPAAPSGDQFLPPSVV